MAANYNNHLHSLFTYGQVFTRIIQRNSSSCTQAEASIPLSPCMMHIAYCPHNSTKFQNFLPLSAQFIHFPTISSHLFGWIYVFSFSLFWPWCIYASCYTRTRRLCTQEYYAYNIMHTHITYWLREWWIYVCRLCEAACQENTRELWLWINYWVISVLATFSGCVRYLGITSSYWELNALISFLLLPLSYSSSFCSSFFSFSFSFWFLFPIY